MGGTLKWSTYLETFFVAGTSHTLDEDYAARFLGGTPIRNRSPYQGIRAVPPAHYLVIAGDNVTAKPHWNWMTDGRIRYRSEVEYEEHFFALFKTSVERRTARDDRIPRPSQRRHGFDLDRLHVRSHPRF
jgi:asparagine synthase (glutamine-hydrolysing)